MRYCYLYLCQSGHHLDAADHWSVVVRGCPDLAVAEMMLWMDLRVLPKEVKFPIIETPNHQRFITTHVPVNALEVVPKAKCICIGLDGREAVWVL